VEDRVWGLYRRNPHADPPDSRVLVHGPPPGPHRPGRGGRPRRKITPGVINFRGEAISSTRDVPEAEPDERVGNAPQAALALVGIVWRRRGRSCGCWRTGGAAPRLSRGHTRREMGPATPHGHEGHGFATSSRVDPGTGIRGVAMKIRSVSFNNKKKAIAVRTLGDDPLVSVREVRPGPECRRSGRSGRRGRRSRT